MKIVIKVIIGLFIMMPLSHAGQIDSQLKDVLATGKTMDEAVAEIVSKQPSKAADVAAAAVDLLYTSNACSGCQCDTKKLGNTQTLSYQYNNQFDYSFRQCQAAIRQAAVRSGGSAYLVDRGMTAGNASVPFGRRGGSGVPPIGGGTPVSPN